MKFYVFTAAMLAGAARQVAALDSAGWRSQSIYQVMVDRFARTDGSTSASCNLNDYCGGSWQGLIDQLDYIQGMGFTAIWISPIVKNVEGVTSDGDSYHGYWAQDIYAVNENFGTSADLVDLSAALHERSMYLMVDIVTNHMGYEGCETCVDYSIYNPFDSSSYFHTPCEIDYDDSESILVCWEGDNTVSLPDLTTEDDDVREIFDSWIVDLIANYTVDGLRADSMLEVEGAFWTQFADAADCYIVGEAFNGDPTVCSEQDYLPGIMNYPTYYWILRAFESTSATMSELASGITTMQSDCSDVTLLGTFIENHDNPRFPSYTSDIMLAANAIGYTMFSDGIPIIYQGQEQHLSGGTTPNNREAIWLTGYDTTATLYTYIQSYNAIRTWAISVDSAWPTTKITASTSSDSKIIAVRKGTSTYPTIAVLNSYGASGSTYTFTMASSFHTYATGTAVTDTVSCTSYTVDSSGNLAVTVSAGKPLILYPTSKLSGSGLCGTSGTTTTVGTTSKTTSTTAKTTTTTSKTSTTTSKTSSTLTTTTCSSAATIAVTFDETVTTTYGETIKIVGDIAALGDWDTSDAVALSASKYTTSSPLWYVSVNLPVGEVVEYKYINVASDGTVTWESDPNHTITVSAASCATATTISNTWQ